MHYFTDLDTLVDDVHGLFERWEEQYSTCEPFSLDTLMAAKLAIHEWVANLKRHATFAVPDPRVGLCVSPSADGLACVVEDNSVGFDLDGYFKKHGSITQVLPESGMGLHWIKSFANNLRYQRAPSGCQQLAFFVPDNNDPSLDILFS
ncbi:MAG: ATP-binding protein [Rhodothermales bacterium]